MANLSGGAEAHARFKQYEYRANSSLVLTTDSRPRDTHEPTGELETLWGRIDRRNFGDRAVQARPPDLLHAALLALSFFLAGALNNGNCLGIICRPEEVSFEALYLAFITPVVYDFYNYDMEKAAFMQLFIKFRTVSVGHTGILAFSLFEFLFLMLAYNSTSPARTISVKRP